MTWLVARRSTRALALQLEASASQRAALERARASLESAHTSAEQASREAREALKRSEESLQALAERPPDVVGADVVRVLMGGLSHELKNPLFSVLANVEYALEAIDELPGELAAGLGEMAEGLTDAKAAARRMRDIIKPLQTYARADARTFAPVDLAEVIAGVLDAERDGTRLDVSRVRWDRARLPMVRGGRDQLSLVIVSLLRNALSSLGASPAEDDVVTLRGWADGDGVLIEITDTGDGIDGEDLQRLFDPFFNNEQGSRAGMGLYICREIVRIHSGEIRVLSVTGEGTTVRVELPVILERRRVLVIDDEPRLAGMVTRWLERDGIAVRAETDARLALQHLQTDPRYDLILCDLAMPEMSGIEFFDSLKAVDPEAADRVRFLTGGAANSYEQRFIKEMRERCKERPISETELVTWIRAALSS